MKNVKTIIQLGDDWHTKLDPEEFNKWTEENGIDWDVKTGMLFRPVMCFESEDDAILFRLKYGI